MVIFMKKFFILSLTTSSNSPQPVVVRCRSPGPDYRLLLMHHVITVPCRCTVNYSFRAIHIPTL